MEKSLWVILIHSVLKRKKTHFSWFSLARLFRINFSGHGSNVSYPSLIMLLKVALKFSDYVCVLGKLFDPLSDLWCTLCFASDVCKTACVLAYIKENLSVRLGALST